MWTLEIERQYVMKELLGDDLYTAYVLADRAGVKYDMDINDGLDISEAILGRMTIDIASKALKYVPVDSGNLKNSFFIDNTPDGVELGFRCDYAFYVHEIAYYRHKKPTRYKFLEDAFYEVWGSYKVDYKDINKMIHPKMDFDSSGVYLYLYKNDIDDDKIDMLQASDYYKKFINKKQIKVLKNEIKQRKILREDQYEAFINYIIHASTTGKGKKMTMNDILGSYFERLIKGTI